MTKIAMSARNAHQARCVIDVQRQDGVIGWIRAQSRIRGSAPNKGSSTGASPSQKLGGVVNWEGMGSMIARKRGF